jgi:uncharacterized protein YraI
LAITGPAAAQAVSGVVTAYVDLYAGPDIGYPPIAQLPAGTPVAIQGCLTGWTWCDVVTMGTRGWVAGTFVQYTYQSQPVIVADYGARIGIPIVAFSIGVYWDNYYRSRPFYRNRDYWYARPIAPRPPPRPPGWRPGYRPPPAPGHRPPPSAGYRPPPGRPPQNRPPQNRPPGQDHRPPPSNNRPPPSSQRPPSGGNRPPPGQGNNRPPPNAGGRPPGQGNRPPPSGGHGGQKPAPRPAPNKQQDNGGH